MKPLRVVQVCKLGHGHIQTLRTEMPIRILHNQHTHKPVKFALAVQCSVYCWNVLLLFCIKQKKKVAIKQFFCGWSNFIFLFFETIFFFFYSFVQRNGRQNHPLLLPVFNSKRLFKGNSLSSQQPFCVFGQFLADLFTDNERNNGGTHALTWLLAQCVKDWFK